MAQIAKMEITEPLLRWSRDMYMLSFYLIGMNWRDLAFVKEVRDGRIYYTRSKGKKSYSIKVFPEAQAIIDRYPGKKYLLDMMDNYSHYKGGTKRINAKLKIIATKCEIPRKISIYYARHSWSTIASDESLGISEDIISRCLGHAVLKPINEITQIYIRKELKPCDDANEKVIKAILKNDDDDVITSLNL
jgi:integrase